MSDKDLLRNRFAANLHSYNSLAIVQQQICDELANMLSAHIEPKQIARGLEPVPDFSLADYLSFVPMLYGP